MKRKRGTTIKKKLVTLLLAIACILVLAGCGCDHQWAEADCVNPRTCTLCGKTEGDPLGHVWMAATCETPKTCEKCGATEGEPKGHSWVEATCEEARHCEMCNLKEGEPLGHKWQEATTEAPKTCETCGATEGERIITDLRFTTADTAPLYGKWALEVKLGAEELELPDFEGEASIYMILNFSNAGDLKVGAEVTDSFVEIINKYTAEAIYAEFAADGVDREEANEGFQEVYGVTIEEYVEQLTNAEYYNEIYSSVFDSIGMSGVYYVADGMLYTGASWDGAMEPTEYALDGDTLYIQELADAMGTEGRLIRIPEE